MVPGGADAGVPGVCVRVRVRACVCVCACVPAPRTLCPCLAADTAASPSLLHSPPPQLTPLPTRPQVNFPRTPRIRKRWLLRRVSELAIFLGLFLFIIQQYVHPTVEVRAARPPARPPPFAHTHCCAGRAPWSPLPPPRRPTHPCGRSNPANIDLPGVSNMQLVPQPPAIVSYFDFVVKTTIAATMCACAAQGSANQRPPPVCAAALRQRQSGGGGARRSPDPRQTSQPGAPPLPAPPPPRAAWDGHRRPRPLPALLAGSPT